MEKTIVDLETGTQEIVPLTADEIAQAQQLTAAWQAEQDILAANAKAQETSKASALAKLTALGLTDDEIKALVG